MQDDEQRVEGIEVDIKGVAPLHIIVLTRVLHQVLVGDHPREADTHIYTQYSMALLLQRTHDTMLVVRDTQNTTPW